ncbi:MAG: bacteriocin-protection protein [Chlorobi bacterium]|nr:bacteriocin-protection protein [Chlorobiota bacterium]
MKTFQAKSRKEWRDWLKKNHAREKEIWLVYYKKHTGKPTIEYMDSVEEAICFGWIDNIKKRIDDEKYAHKFTVRKVKSKWSPLNIRLAEKMIKEKKMTSAGLTFFEQRIEYDKEFIKTRASDEITLTQEIEQELKKNEKAWRNFLKLAPGYKKQYVLWLISAKKEITKQKRLEEAIILLEQNRKLGMK